MRRDACLILTAALGAFAVLGGGASAQGFGGTVALDGEYVIVGETQNGQMSGVVRLYTETGSGWAEVTRLEVADNARTVDGFGRALAADAGWLWVGAPLEAGGEGRAYVYQLTGTDWEPVAAVSGPGGENAGFGSVVVVKGDVAFVAAPGAGSGVVHEYRRGTDGGWVPAGVLTASEDAGVEGFGASLATDGSTLLIGTAEPEEEIGAVFSYIRDAEGNWVMDGSLTPPVRETSTGFGSAVAINGGTALVGAPSAFDGVGTVYQFHREDGVWTLERRLGAVVAVPGARFGTFVAFEGVDVVVGAPGGFGGGGTLFKYAMGGAANWLVTTLEVGEEESRGFASNAAMGDGRIAVGTPGSNRVMLAAAIDSGWEEEAFIAADPRWLPSIAGSEVECVDSRADAFECRDVHLTAFMPIGDLGGGGNTRVNDVWGWTDPETGREIAIVGRTDGTSFVDVSNPYNPRYLGDLPATAGSRHMIWRDIKVYRDHAYIVADAALEHGVQVFDLRQLRDVGMDPVTFEETYLYDGIHSAHNIVINEETGFAYAVGNSGGGETCGGGLHMMDLSDPAVPVFAGCFAQEGSGRRGTGYVHDAQCVIYNGPDTEHVGREICLGSNETHFNIVDVTNKEAPTSLATLSYPNVAYAHQGWLTDDHRYFYMNDEGDEPQGLVDGTRTLVWDVIDLDDPLLVNEYIAETTATDHNLYVKGNFMYQSNYSAGFRVLDISDPENPVEVGFFDTSPYEGGASWSNYPFFESGVIPVTGTGDGLFLLKNMAAPRIIP